MEVTMDRPCVAQFSDRFGAYHWSEGSSEDWLALTLKLNLALMPRYAYRTVKRSCGV